MNEINKNVSFSTLDSIRENYISNWSELSWTEFADFLEGESHLVTRNKDVTLISPWKYKTPMDDFEPCMTSKGPLLVIDGKRVVGRLASNVLGTDMIMFDFDSTITINEAKSLFSKYMHLGYTSFNHKSEAKGNGDCFRVVVPLAQFVTATQLVERRAAIYADFPGVDTSCMSRARCFYRPSVQPERKDVAQMWRNDGVFFDVLDYAPKTYTVPVNSPASHQAVDREKVITALKGVYLGKEQEWFKVAVAMQSNNFSFEQFCDVSIGYLMKRKDRRDCETKWNSAKAALRRGQSISVGFLINVCKSHGTWAASRPKLTTERAIEIDQQINEIKRQLKELA